jgi:hypothetical protein
MFDVAVILSILSQQILAFFSAVSSTKPIEPFPFPPVTGHGGSQGCQPLKLPHFLDDQLINGGEVASLMRRDGTTALEF